MTSLTTFLLGNFFFNLKQLSKFEWVFLFFFLTQIWHLTKKRKKKQNEEKKYEINGPGQANKKKLCWRNKSREKKRTFRLIPKLLFFSLWPMTTSDQWQQVFLFETSSICLPEWLCWKKKETIHWPNASEVVGEFNQKKKTTLLSQLKKKKNCGLSQCKKKDATSQSEKTFPLLAFYHWA